MRSSIAVLLVISVLASACSVFPGSVLPTPTAAVPTPFETSIQAPRPVLEAQKALAGLLGVPPDTVTIVSFKEAQWPNGCLGLDTPAMTCTAVITPGYQVILENNARRYEYRTDLEGGLILPGDVVVDRMEEYAPLVQALANHLNVNAGDITFVRAKPMQWSSPCLDYINPAELCAQALTPGLMIFLQQADQVFEVHTDLALTHARLPGGVEILAQ